MNRRQQSPILELLPAALLSHRQQWRQAAESLPNGAYLLVTDPGNATQTQLMMDLARAFREKGHSVVVWNVHRWVNRAECEPTLTPTAPPPARH
jgi:hypothetical protein